MTESDITMVSQAIKEAVKKFTDQINIICQIEDINKRVKFVNIEIEKLVKVVEAESDYNNALKEI